MSGVSRPGLGRVIRGLEDVNSDHIIRPGVLMTGCWITMMLTRPGSVIRLEVEMFQVYIL